jgi:hypothetical protein
MTAPALRIVPNVDDIRDRIGDLPRMTMPRLEEVGRQADATVDRLRGRPARPSWLRPLLVIGVIGVVAALAAMAMSWTRSRAGRWTNDDAIDRFDRLSEPVSPDGGTSADQPAMGGFGSPSLTTTGGVSFDDHEAEVR